MPVMRCYLKDPGPFHSFSGPLRELRFIQIKT